MARSRTLKMRTLGNPRRERSGSPYAPSGIRVAWCDRTLKMRILGSPKIDDASSRSYAVSPSGMQVARRDRTLKMRILGSPKMDDASSRSYAASPSGMQVAWRDRTLKMRILGSPKIDDASSRSYAVSPSRMFEHVLSTRLNSPLSHTRSVALSLSGVQEEEKTEKQQKNIHFITHAHRRTLTLGLFKRTR